MTVEAAASVSMRKRWCCTDIMGTHVVPSRTQEEWERDVFGFKQKEALAFADTLFAETKAFEMKEQMAAHPVSICTMFLARALLPLSCQRTCQRIC